MAKNPDSILNIQESDARKSDLSIEERKKMARNALVLGKLTEKDIAKTYDIPLSTIIGMKGYLGSRGKLIAMTEEEGGGGGRLPALEWWKPASGQPNGDASDQKIERIERQLEEIRAMLQESGIEKAL